MASAAQLRMRRWAGVKSMGNSAGSQRTGVVYRSSVLVQPGRAVVTEFGEALSYRGPVRCIGRMLEIASQVGHRGESCPERGMHQPAVAPLFPRMGQEDHQSFGNAEQA